MSGFSRFWRQWPPIESFHSGSVVTASSVRSKRKKENLFRVSPYRYIMQKPPKTIKIKTGSFHLFHLMNQDQINNYLIPTHK